MVRTKRLSWSMFWAVVSYLITTLAAALTSYLTSLEVTPLQGSLISTGVGLGVVLLGVFIDHVKQRPEELPPPPMQRPGQRPTGRTSWAAAIVLILVLCGGGGLAITYGAHWVAQKAVVAFDDVSAPPWEKKTREPGAQRLASPATKTSGPLTITVTSVEVNSHVTIVKLTAKNTGDDTITLPDFGSPQITVPGASTLQPDPAAGDWGREVPADGELTGTIVFDGVLGPQVTRVTFSFTNIYGGFDAPRSISVDVRLKPAN